MRLIVGIGSCGLIFLILLDAFESVLLPRRVTHGYRFMRLFYRTTWRGWRRLVQQISSPHRRESMLGMFGPLALIGLFSAWSCGLVVAFGLLHWSLETPITADGGNVPPSEYLYFSGTTFFTLGYGDLTPTNALGRFLAVVETGLGFGFLAMVVSYHPVLTQAFSKREIVIALLDARGGSPPTAAEILIRRRGSHAAEVMNSDLAEWETWSAELLESFLSFPMLAYYRSQHDNQSWLAALTVILDSCALEICGVGSSNSRQARLTMAMARHAAVDLTLIFKITPKFPESDRLGPILLDKLKQRLATAQIPVSDWPTTEANLAEMRGMYEPFLNGLSQYFLLYMPEFVPLRPKADNWQTSAWMPRTPGFLELQDLERGDHF